MSTRSVYVVTGRTGAYDEHREWNVLAHLDEQAAEAMAARLNAWCVERGVSRDDEISTRLDIEALGHPPEDPDFACDHEGASYSVTAVPLAGEL